MYNYKIQSNPLLNLTVLHPIPGESFKGLGYGTRNADCKTTQSGNVNFRDFVTLVNKYIVFV